MLRCCRSLVKDLQLVSANRIQEFFSHGVKCAPPRHCCTRIAILHLLNVDVR